MNKLYDMTNVIKILSYNIWFDDTLCIERTLSLIDVIINLNPDVICLQEVRPQIYEILINKLNDYRYHYPKKIDKMYGCCNLSKYPITKCLEYKFNNSNMGRSLIITKIDYPYHNKTEEGISVDKVDIVVTNAHFESLFKKNKVNDIKIEQYEISSTILNKLYNAYKNVILCSDTNIMNHEEEEFKKMFNDNSWIDLWELKGSEEDKYTYNSSDNIHLYKKFPKIKLQSRIDRLLFRSDNLTGDEFNLIKGGTYEPSDHFGVQGKFIINRDD